MLKRILSSRKFWLGVGVIVGGLAGAWAHKKKHQNEDCTRCCSCHCDDEQATNEFEGMTVADFINGVYSDPEELV